MSDSDPIETFSFIASALSQRGLGLSARDRAGRECRRAPAGARRATPILRSKFNGTLIANGGYDLHTAQAAIASGEADLVAFGVPFLANPDLPVRYQRKAALNAPDQATFYAGEEKGYIDYPALA